MQANIKDHHVCFHRCFHHLQNISHCENGIAPFYFKNSWTGIKYQKSFLKLEYYLEIFISMFSLCCKSLIRVSCIFAFVLQHNIQYQIVSTHFVQVTLFTNEPAGSVKKNEGSITNNLKITAESGPSNCAYELWLKFG